MADKIKGNTDGLKAALIREYEQYLGCQCGPGEYVPAELTAAMAKFTGETGREIAFVLDRRNYVTANSAACPARGCCTPTPTARTPLQRRIWRRCGAAGWMPWWPSAWTARRSPA